MEAEVRTITPKQAEKWLGNNTENRNVRLRRVEEYARDMLAGKWILNGESIVLDKQGRLIDGQHRLLALCMANVSVKMLVVEGVEPDAKATLDTGMKRSLGDVLRMQGEASVAHLSAAINMGWRWETGGLREHRMPTRAEALAWLDKNPAIRDAIAVARPTILPPVRLPMSVAAPFTYFAETVSSQEDVEKFVAEVASGANLSETSGTFKLRNYLLTSGSEVNYRGATRSFVKLAYVIKAWNAWIDGAPVKSLHWRGGGAQAEEFPILRGPNGTFKEGGARTSSALIKLQRNPAQREDTLALAHTLAEAGTSAINTTEEQSA